MKSLFILTLVVIFCSCQKDATIIDQPIEAKSSPPKTVYIYTTGNTFSNCVNEYIHYAGRVGYIATSTRAGAAADIALQFSGALQAYSTPSGSKCTLNIDDSYTIHIPNTSFLGYQIFTPIVIGGTMAFADGRLYGTRVFLTARVRSNLSIEISVDRFTFSCNKNEQ